MPRAASRRMVACSPAESARTSLVWSSSPTEPCSARAISVRQCGGVVEPPSTEQTCACLSCVSTSRVAASAMSCCGSWPCSARSVRTATGRTPPVGIRHVPSRTLPKPPPPTAAPASCTDAIGTSCGRSNMSDATARCTMRSGESESCGTPRRSASSSRAAASASACRSARARGVSSSSSSLRSALRRFVSSSAILSMRPRSLPVVSCSAMSAWRQTSSGGTGAPSAGSG